MIFLKASFSDTVSLKDMRLSKIEPEARETNFYCRIEITLTSRSLNNLNNVRSWTFLNKNFNESAAWYA